MKKVFNGKDLEWFLRRNFGLIGEYHSQEYKDAFTLSDEDARSEAYDAILEAKGPEGYYTKEAWAAWGKALQVIDDLVAMGLLEDGIHSPAQEIREGFCDIS
jgi:hypothetical protein